MTVIMGVRNGSSVRYVSVEIEFGIEKRLPEWASDEHAAAALLAFGPLREIGHMGLWRNPYGARGEVEGDDDTFITTALREYSASVVALYDPPVGDWQVWDVGEAVALRAIARADTAISTARELAGQALALLDASKRMKAKSGVIARSEARELAGRAAIQLRTANDALSGRRSRLHNALAIRDATAYLGDASTKRRSDSLGLCLTRGIQEMERFMCMLEERRKVCEKVASSLPSAALQPLPCEESELRE